MIDVQAKFALKADASRYFLGYVWWILEPLLYVGVFYVVFNVILNSRHPDFLTFLMCGKLPFVWFSKSVITGSNAIVSNAGLIGKINVPKTLFPMARIQEGVYKQMAVFALLIAVVVINGYSPSWIWLWLLPVIALNYLMIVACAFVGAVLVCYFRDFSMIISLGMTFLMFTSGIFWDVRTLSDPALTELILNVNPVAFILDAYRQILMGGVAPDLGGMLRYALIFGMLAAGMVFIMRKLSQALALKALTA
ncbi:ABC transporter permease [Parahaliea aestuarii]|uniref:ABC transporter permease n=1 Tax=Parahaliea aestuarii TaxID=1852021 RepID=UPI001FE2525F|nr:ABC transporter permease [Parahaliea aestuarii]